LIIQNFIDSLQEMTYTVVKIRAKEKFGEILKERRISMDRFARMSNLSAATIKLAKLGQRTINMESANKIARTLEMPKEMLFDITSEVRPYASQSNAKTVSILKHMLSMAKRYDVIEKNYASSEYVKGVSAMSKETPIMDLDDTLKALECLKKDEDIRAVTAVLIGIYMGRRRGEVAGLMWTDIDLDNGEMTVERSRSPVTGKGVVEKEPKSIYSAKTYAMPATLTKQLIKYKEWWDDYVENVVGDKYEGKPYLFLQYTGKAIYPTTIYTWWKKLQKKHGLKEVHYHSLRKTNISVQYASNQIPSEIIAGRAGHANDKVTKQNYLKIFKKDDHKTAEIVDSLFACK
jgi:integrase